MFTDDEHMFTIVKCTFCIGKHTFYGAKHKLHQYKQTTISRYCEFYLHID